MSTGDLRNNIKKLQAQIKSVKYAGKLDLNEIKDGSSTAFLPLYHYVFTSYSSKLNKDISNSNNELYGKSDLRFIEALYKILRDMFSYKPPVTREQFFLPGFAERKVIMATEILQHVHSMYKPPSNSSSYKLASKLEKKQHEIHTRVQANSQGDLTSQTKPRKVAGKGKADLTEAIVLPRYVSSSLGSWRESATPNTCNTTDLSDSDSSPHYSQPKSPPPSHPAEEEVDNAKTQQFTEHITNALSMLNMQVGKISNALLKVETQIAARDSPRTPQQPATPTPSLTDKLQMDTLLSKVVLLENRMTLLESKVEDIQSFCTIMLENQSRNNSNNVNSQNTAPTEISHSTQVAGSARFEDSGLHPSYVKAFAPVADMNVKVASNTRNDENFVKENGENIDDVVIEDVEAFDSDINRQTMNKRTEMEFMKTLVGPYDTDTSLAREQDDSITPRQQPEPTHAKPPIQPKQKPKASNDSKQTQPRFENHFSPIQGHKDSSLLQEDENSLIHIPFAGRDEEDFDSHRLSSTPNKADLDSSTISRVHRIMQMMKETKDQFGNENS